jgi:hypothetical protein
MIKFYNDFKEPIDLFRDICIINVMSYIDLIEIVNNTSEFTVKSKKNAPSMDLKTLLFQSLIYSVDMIRLIGLAHFIIKIAPLYSNIFKTFRLIIYDEIQNESNKKSYETFSKDLLAKARNQINDIISMDEFVYISYEEKVFEFLMSMVKLNFFFKQKN